MTSAGGTRAGAAPLCGTFCLTEPLIRFFERQHTVVVSTLDSAGGIHTSAKGIVGIEASGTIYLMDVYRQKTLANLRINPAITITAVDDHRFEGYALKGRARICERHEMEEHIVKKWEERIIRRISERLIRNLQQEKRIKVHPEAQLPAPEHLIIVEVEEIIDLTPAHIRKGMA